LVAQKLKWQDPLEQKVLVVQGKLPTMTTNSFQRLPDDIEQEVRPPVWSLSRQNAGLYIEFVTNAEAITIRYQVSEPVDMPHMPATGVSGLDLYAKNINGSWDWAAGSYRFGDTISYRFNNLSVSKEEKFRLYLPLYNSVTWMEIGVKADADLRFLTSPKENPIVVYGTSIAQGACASRPGLAWTSILGRQLDLPIINLGFSGNGQLEQPLIELISTIDARMFILDCMPNLTVGSFPEKEIEERIKYSVAHLKSKHPNTPILLTEHSGGATDQIIDTARSSNYRYTSKIIRRVYTNLVRDGVKGIYLLEAKAISMGTESTVDGIHPNDIGMMQHATAYRNMITSIFNR